MQEIILINFRIFSNKNGISFSCNPVENHKPSNPDAPQMYFNYEISHPFACQHLKVWAVKWRPLAEILDNYTKKVFRSFFFFFLNPSATSILYDPVYHDATNPGAVGAARHNSHTASNLSSPSPLLLQHRPHVCRACYSWHRFTWHTDVSRCSFTTSHSHRHRQAG